MNFMDGIQLGENINNICYNVIKRFHGWEEIILYLYQINHNFREMCDHFEQTSKMLELNRQSTITHSNITTELQTFIRELEVEILRNLKEFKGAARSHK